MGKPKKMATDPVLISRAVVEADIGEPLTPSKTKRKKASQRIKK